MNSYCDIRHLYRHEIDEEKWSHCVEDAVNSRVYANYWYLDKVTESWEAYIWGDYQFIMPIPVRKKWGIKYVYQPLFSQQLGIFPVPPENIQKGFISILTNQFLFAETNLNAYHENIEVIKNIEIISRNNFLLPLAEGYPALSANFATNTKRNIVKSDRTGLQLVTGMQVSEFIAFKCENSPGRLKKKDTDNLRNLVTIIQYKGMGDIQGVYSAKNELIAAVFFLRWKNRLIYLSASSNDEGKKLGAMYFLVNKAIQEHAGEPLVLDFEGSMIQGVARFYSGFGAYSETYYQLILNRLPWPLKILKREK